MLSYRTSLELSGTENIIEFQRFNGLKADGVVGPKTAMKFYETRFKQFRGECEVIDNKYIFGKLRKRSSPPRMVVIHDSISRTAERTFYDLLHASPRQLSTAFIIDYDGTIIMCCNPLTEVAVHSGALNDESIGIDVVNQLDPKLAFDTDKDIDVMARDRIVDADWSASSFMPKKAICYTDKQKASLAALCNALSSWLNIPKVTPSELTGYGKCNEWVKESNFCGFIAHGQWSTKRWDGLFGVECLWENGYEKISKPNA